MARRGKKKSLARRIRRLVFLASAGAAIVKFAMARRPKTQPSSPQAPEWAPLRTAPETKSAPETQPAADIVAATNSDTPASSPAWVRPVDGACPVTHPVKGKTNSKIYHVPGGRF